jgi:putative tricarboxylic transport membrane protein
VTVRGAVAPALGLGLVAGLFAATGSFDPGLPAGQLGPGFWPRLVLICLGAACAVRLAGALGRAPASTEHEGDRGAPIARGRMASAIGLILLYVLAAPLVGFPVATLAFFAAFMWTCGARSIAGIGAGAIAATIGLLYLFVKAVYLPLPKGDGPFETVTLTLYRLLRLF